MKGRLAPRRISNEELVSVLVQGRTSAAKIFAAEVRDKSKLSKIMVQGTVGGLKKYDELFPLAKFVVRVIRFRAATFPVD